MILKYHIIHIPHLAFHLQFFAALQDSPTEEFRKMRSYA